MPLVLPPFEIKPFPYSSLEELLSWLPSPLCVLKSSGSHPKRDRYSTYAFSPFGSIETNGKGKTTLLLKHQRKTLSQYPHQWLAQAFPPTTSSSPFPFTGGALGFFSYEYGQYLDRMGTAQKECIPSFPQAFFYLYKNVLVMDEIEKKGYWLYRDQPSIPTAPRPLSPSQIPAFFVEASKERFINTVNLAQEEINKGEIYQANLSLLFKAFGKADPRWVFARLFSLNPSPFSFFMETDHGALVSCSPERLIAVKGRKVFARPIAGTHPRGSTPYQDLQMKREMVSSCKEKAEHVMLVDLARNDLGKVCQPGSVQVQKLYEVETYSHVHHIVSNIQGELSSGKQPLDALSAFFPGGTITGCPKIRSTEIIAALEKRKRHFYTGSFGYIEACGQLDFNIIIRTLLIKDKEISFYAGAGIVKDSQPEEEFEEILYKQEALRCALQNNKKVIQKT